MTDIYTHMIFLDISLLSNTYRMPSLTRDFGTDSILLLKRNYMKEWLITGETDTRTNDGIRYFITATY